MSNERDNGSAAATPFTHKPEYQYQEAGLTKREAFAMSAMQNVMLNYNPWEQGDFDSSNYEDAAIQAVGLADALLKELDK